MTSELTVFGDGPPKSDLTAEVTSALSESPKRLPTKLLYDERGSQLFDKITQLDEYYPTRTEVLIMGSFSGQIVERIEHHATMIELGSGSSTKTRMLLSDLPNLRVYVPVDISREHLLKSASSLNQDYPALRVQPVWADYTRGLPIPPQVSGKPLVYFPGSTIGNFTTPQASAFLQRIGEAVGDGAGLLIGVDLYKDEKVLLAAYNDADGVTAAFNTNLLTHVNRVCKANFYVDAFSHKAIFDRTHSRIEMHLIAQSPQVVSIGDSQFEIEAGEHLLTEFSYKYKTHVFHELLARAGWQVEQSFDAPNGYFSVIYCQR